MTTTTDHRDDVEDVIGTIDPATMRDGATLRALAAARQHHDEAQTGLVEAVRAARAAGDSWTSIGVVLRTSRQAAHRKYAPLLEKTSPPSASPR
jgi:hypothetical protein